MPWWMAAFEFSKEFPAVLPWEVAQKVPLLWWRRWLLILKARFVRDIHRSMKGDPRIMADKNVQNLLLWANPKKDK